MAKLQVFKIHYNIQAIFKNENERRCSERTDLDIVLYVRRISRHLKGEYVREFGVRKLRI